MQNWKDYVRRVEPYVPGEQPQEQNIIKLNTNENPYGPSPRVKEMILNPDDLRLYPDPSASSLTKNLAKYHGVKEEQVFVGVGSDDVLAMAFMTFFNSDLPILFPDITYSFYDVWAEMLRIPYKTKPLNADFRLNKEDYFCENGGIVLANPNAPTSIFEPLSTIKEILDANKDSVVIIDEAYIDFGGESALPLLSSYENLLVVRTYSKSRSMAGLRIGYAIGNSELIKCMQDVKYSYNSYTMNRPSLLYGSVVLADEEYFRESVAKIVRTRERFSEQLRELGFELPQSSANFVFAKPTKVGAEELFTKLKDRRIYVRYFKKPRINEYLRITIGTDAEMDKLLEAIREIQGE